jgi:hypothetical protein
MTKQIRLVVDKNSKRTESTQESAQKKAQSVSEDERERFQKLLNKKQTESQLEKANLIQLNNTILSAQIMPDLSSSNAVTTVTATSTIQSMEDRYQVLQNLMDQVQSMSVRSTAENKEVRIVLNMDVLNGTEIRVDATNHQLIVQFITNSGATNKWLDQRLFTCQTLLEKNLQRPVDLTLYAGDERLSNQRPQHA